MLNSKIYATGSYLPPTKVSTSSILEYAGLNRFAESGKMMDQIGIDSVRHCPASMKPSDVAILAAEKALARHPGELSDIDAVIYCGMTRDMQEPSTAHRIADKLGINARLCPDIADACHGFTAGLITANALIKSNQFNNILVCTGETPSKGTFHIAERFKRSELTQLDIKDNLGAFTVGDAGGAMILGAIDDGSGFQAFNTNAKSSVRKACYVDWETNSFAMHMLWISKETIKMVRRMTPETLRAIGWNSTDIGSFIAHQVGRGIQDSYLRLLNIDRSQSIETYKEFGNLTSATLPVCYDMLEKQGLLTSGKKVLMFSTGSGITVTQTGYVV